MPAKTKKFRQVILPLLLGIVGGSFLIGSLALAQLQTGLEYGTATGLGTQDLRVSIMQIIRVVLGFLGVLALVIVFYGGWVWMTAAGNADRIELAKRILVNAVIGLAIIFSAFMITSFIINQLLDATGAGPGQQECIDGQINPNNSCQICQGGNYVNDYSLPGCDTNLIDECVVENITPSGINKPMNSIARVRFNHSSITNAATIQVYDITTNPAGVLVPTTQNVNGDMVELTPIASCPAPNAGLNCFTANSTFEIRADDSSITCGGEPLICGVLGGNNCIRTFSTGSALDLFPPTITLIGNQTCQNPTSRLEAMVNDDYGISYVDFFETQIIPAPPGLTTLVGSDGYVTVPPAEIASVAWDTSGYNVGDVITIDATAVDYDSNPVDAAPLDITIQAGHCCNLVRDADETGLDCGGNDCEACTPVIEWVDPLDGAPGNLITIHGRRFESDPGQVVFTGSGALGTDPSLSNPICSGYWKDQEIVIGIPAGAADGALQVVRADLESDRTDQLPGSNIADFNVNSTVRPGLCAVPPGSAAPSTPVSLLGLNFISPSTAYFGGLQAGGSPNVISPTVISGATVPLVGAGDVQVRAVNLTNPLDPEFSNPITFDVDPTIKPPVFGCSLLVTSCSPTVASDALCNPGFECNPATCGCEPIDPPDPDEIICDSDPDNFDINNAPICDPDNSLCPNGYVCGNSCKCQPDVAAGNTSAYTWFFTTTSLGPRVAETCNRAFGCEVGAISSPTPFNRAGTNFSGAMVGQRKDDGAVPIDAIVGANFTDQMQAASLSAATIRVSACGSAATQFNAAACNPISGVVAATPISFQYTPSTLLTPDTWYQVVLSAAQIFGANGVSLAPNDQNNNYSWVFRTRASAELGEVGCVYVDPASQTSYQIGDQKEWTGQAADKDFSCVVLNPQTACVAGWSWSLGSNEAALLPPVGNQAVTEALLETEPGPGVPVIAECNLVVGSVAGTGEHNIDFSSPVVVGRFPNCGTACLNSKVGVTFNMPMDDTSVENAISLHICFDDPNCVATPQNLINFSDFIANDPDEAAFSYTGTVAPGDADGNGTDDFWLLPNNYYRVVVTNVAQSALEAEPLANLNYSTTGGPDNDAYSWVFKTQNNFGACLPHTINVKPVSALAQVGNSILYSGQAKTSFDQCFGQSLDPYSFDWDWESTDENVADFRTTGNALRDACGNGVIEQGEDCDDGNLDSNDGCSGNGSPLGLCLTENDSDSGNENYNQDVCGNGIVEFTEQCEKPGARGCSNTCVLSGSVPGFSLCGDGIIGIGEQCDDADLLLGGLAQSNDGCSNRCIIEDASQSFCRSENTLRFDFKQGQCGSNADCTPGYSCLQLSDAAGNSNSDPVCGNGLIEAGEECDFGGVCSNDSDIICTSSNEFVCGNPFTTTCNVVLANGCSDSCTNAGSVQEANDPPNVGPFQIVDALNNGLTNIQTWIASFAPPAGPLGSGALQVGAGSSTNDPTIIERYPDCATACGNAGIGAVFNVPMTLGTLNSSNIALYECGSDPLCNLAGLLPIPASVVPYPVVSSNDAVNILLPLGYNPTDIDGNGSPDGPALLPNTYYRVVVSNQVTDAGLNRNLVGLNFDSPTNPIVGLDSHSWVFKTQASSAFCTVGRVEVHPEEITLPEGTLQTYFSEPWALGGSCDPLFGSNRGQRLNPYFYDWRWDTFETDTINVADVLVPFRDGCGNSVVEFGEDCDDGNLTPFDGCGGVGSAVGLCQREGSNYSASSLSICGNSTRELGEDCDDGNITNGDGCSNICLREGNTNYAASVCGNGVLEAGEQCDTGSEPNGNEADGCNDICTFSGAVPATNSICGDGQIGLGENCDQGELAAGQPVVSNNGCTGNNNFSSNPCSSLTTQASCQNFDNAQWCYWTGSACQTRACLAENVFGTAMVGNDDWNLPVCGNGVVEAGEECDLGGTCSDNGAACTNLNKLACGSTVASCDVTAGNGCSNRCLFAGSVYDDGRLDPYQIVQTSAIGSPVAEVNEEIRAWHNLASSIVGVGELKVVSGGLVDFAVIGHRPPVGDPNAQCLNVSLAATFSRALDLASLTPDNFRLCQGAGCTIASPNLVTELSYRSVNGSCVNNFCQFPQADNLNLEFGFCSSNSDCAGSQVSIADIDTPDGFLARNETYRIIIDPVNLLDANGTALGTSCSTSGNECNWSFQTSDNFCSCDFVGVGITNTSGGADTIRDTFTCASDACGSGTTLDPRDDDADSNAPGNQHLYNATCYDVNNPSGNRIALNPLGHYFTYTQFDPGLILADFPQIASFDPAEVVTAENKNGKAGVRVVATEFTCSSSGQLCNPAATSCPVPFVCRGTNTACDPTSSTACGNDQASCVSSCQPKVAATQTVSVTNFICNNPWPEVNDFPYLDNEDNANGPVDPDTNFSLFYCRDFGGASTDDDLPALGQELVSLSGGPAIKDFLFPIPANGDALGIKVLRNPLHLSPATWYRTGLCDAPGPDTFDKLCFSDADCEGEQSCRLNIFDQGGFSDLKVDGYEAVREGRTVYVGATNLDAADEALYSNIYLISYSQDASPATIEIFNRILDRNQVKGAWTFNNPPDFSNHRICQNSGYYQGTDIPCTTVGYAQTIVCESPGILTQSSCEAEAASGCYWSPSLNDCLSSVCEPIICTSDFECPDLFCNADKEMLIRDAKRYGDLRNIQLQLENYASRVGRYPSLSAGSYVPSTTFSIWPSWQQTLARDLNTTLTTDPLNRFVRCPGFTCDANGNGTLEVGEDSVCAAAVDTITCPAPGACIPVDADQARTCWDEVNLQFSCPLDAVVYAYRAAENGLAYQLFSRFEYEGLGNWRTEEAPDLYQLPLSNLAGPSCELLNLEIGAATISGGTTQPVLNEFRCFGGTPNDGTEDCVNAIECSNMGYGPNAKCTPDADGDGIEDFGLTDNCAPTVHCSGFPNFPDCFNPDQADADLNDIGDACDPGCSDDDKDLICHTVDNCSNAWNTNQADIDGDGIGDVCDSCIDIDGDGYGSPGTDECEYGAALDCQDDPSVEPLAIMINQGITEICNDGVDNNCDNKVDTQDAITCPVDTCSDTDLGLDDFETRGTATGSTGGSTFANTDFCTGAATLTEYGCNGTALDQDPSVNCVLELGAGYTCSAGRCIPPVPQPDSCSDTDGGSPTPSQTLGSISGFENGGQAFSHTDACTSPNSLTEWGCSGAVKTSSPVTCLSGWSCNSGICVAPPPPPDSCNDSDAGPNALTTIGNISGFGGGSAFSISDVCSGAAQVTEQSCSGVTPVSTPTPCPGTNICLNGQCVPLADSCSDTDGADDNYITFGTTSGSAGGAPYSHQDTCVTGSPTASLTEWGCNGTTESSDTFPCTSLGAGYTCSAGRCVPPADSCSDTDGSNFQSPGTVSGFSGGSSYSLVDSCSGSGNVGGNLTERTCSGSAAIASSVNCATALSNPAMVCNNGACIVGTEAGLCFDGLNNDNDGATDCADSDCNGASNGSNPSQVCCSGATPTIANGVCANWINTNTPNNCASTPTCTANTCSFTASPSLCGSGTNACGTCNPTNFTCQANTSACTGNCNTGCVDTDSGAGFNFQCQADQNDCPVGPQTTCSTCQNSGAGAFNCVNINNGQDCDGSAQCCSAGTTCNGATPPQCISCTDSDRDGTCDNDDWCPYDPDQNSDFDNLCAVGCTSGSNPSGSPFSNGRLCDDGTPSPSDVLYDTCVGGTANISSGICNSGFCSNDGDPCTSNAQCTNFNGSCPAAGSCLVLFGADQRLNVYIDGLMVAGNLYLPPGYVTNGELLGGNGTNNYPAITGKIFVNVGNFVGTGQSVVGFEALSSSWPLRQIRGAFVNSSESGTCDLLNYSPKFTRNHLTNPVLAFPSYCYTDDNFQNTGIAPAPQGAQAWNDVNFNPVGAPGWALARHVGQSSSGPLTSLWTSTDPTWMFNNPVGIWSINYPAAFTYSHAYCRSTVFTQ